MSILFGSETPKLKPGAIKTVGHELHDPRQAPEERHVYSHERPSSQPSSGGAACVQTWRLEEVPYAAPTELGWLLGRSWL